MIHTTKQLEVKPPPTVLVLNLFKNFDQKNPYLSMAIRCDRACAYPAWTSKPVEIWSRDSDDLNNTLFVDYLAYNEEVPLPRY